MFEVREVQTREDLHEVYRFRYDQHFHRLTGEVPGVDHARKIVREPHDEDSIHFVVMDGDRMCAVVTDTPLTSSRLPKTWYDIFRLDFFADADPAKAWVTTHLVLHAEHRRSAALGTLIAHMFEHGMAHGTEFKLMYCAPHLVGMYEQLGFRRYTDNFNLSRAGVYRIPMVFAANDFEQLKKVRSPLSRTARKYQKPKFDRAALRAMLPDIDTYVNARLMGEDELYGRIAGAMLSDPTDTPEIFRELSEEDIRSVVRRSVLLDVNKGDRLIRQGSTAEEMFLVMQGVYEGILETSGRPISLKLFGPGEIFGELSFLRKTARTADIHARTDGQVLIFNEDFLERLRKSRPEIGFTLVHNLLKIVAGRLSATDIRIAELVDRQEE